MKKIKEWLKCRIRPYFLYKPNKEDCPSLYDNIDSDNDVADNIENLKDNTEVGFKITFKF